jgi:3-mercaptopyruvate sulfurtransferase SseA
MLMIEGFADVQAIKGGFQAWLDAGYPIASGS